MTPRETWRLLNSGHADGASNMALDVALLESVAAGSAPPTLRLYGWSPPCLSLGYNQPTEDADFEALEANGWDIVRRPTGGRAILHTDELTYAVVAPAQHPLVAGGVLESYRRISLGLVAALEMLGSAIDPPAAEPAESGSPMNPVCFEVPSAYEITHAGRKLVGSAQVRRRGGVLQHGSLPLEGDLARICQVLHYPDDAARQSAATRVRLRASTLSEALGHPVSWEQAAAAVAQGFGAALELELKAGRLTSDEIAWMRELRRENQAAGGGRRRQTIAD